MFYQNETNNKNEFELNTSQALYNRIESIKSTISIVNAERPELWVQRQNLQDLYHQIILNDVDFTIDKKLEQELWNLVFKNQINYFQNQIKENSSAPTNPNSSKMMQKKVEAQANLSFFLEAARGFYTKLLEDLIKKYDLNELKNNNTGINVSFYQRFPSVFDRMNQKYEEISTEFSSINKEKQIFYICQHILTHLGDIARYANQFQEAKNYYLHAIKLVPYLGHPYNQLGILFETSRTNQLSTVFYYIRSIALKHTFPLAANNLENFFHKLIDIPISRYNSTASGTVLTLSQKELLNLFLQLNAIFYSCLFGKQSKSITSSSKLTSFFDLFKTSFKTFLQTPQQTDKLDSKQFCELISIVIFQLTNQPTQSSQSDSKLKEIYDFAYEKVLELFVFLIEQFILIYNQSLEQNNIQLCDLVLPSLYLSFSFVEYFKNGFLIKDNKLWTQLYGSDVLKINSFTLSTVIFLNHLSKNLNIDLNNYKDYPLNEDRMLDSFLPLKEAHKNYSFKKYITNNLLLNDVSEASIRKARILACFERLVSKSDTCFIKIEDALKFSLSQFCPKFKSPELSNQEQQQQQPLRRKRQNLAISSMINELNSQENLTKINQINSQTAKSQLFPSSSLSTFPSQQRFQANQLNWQINQSKPDYNSVQLQQQQQQQQHQQQQQGSFFPSASTRQNQISLNRNLNNSVSNTFPSFLPNQNFSFQNQSQTPNDQSYLSDLLIQQLITNSNNNINSNTDNLDLLNQDKPLEYNFNMLSSLAQNNTGSIWSYPSFDEQNKS